MTLNSFYAILKDIYILWKHGGENVHIQKII